MLLANFFDILVKVDHCKVTVKRWGYIVLRRVVELFSFITFSFLTVNPHEDHRALHFKMLNRVIEITG